MEAGNFQHASLSRKQCNFLHPCYRAIKVKEHVMAMKSSVCGNSISKDVYFQKSFRIMVRINRHLRRGHVLAGCAGVEIVL